ncbi:hypothetical protein B0O99DRAFT_748061, partial [Bisporella sp. PMI_857]
MAEIISLVAATAQFLDIAIRLSVKLSRIGSEIRDAPKRLQDLRISLNQQISLVRKIQTNTSQLFATSVIRLAELTPILQEYNSIMNSLDSLLQGLISPRDQNFIHRGWSTVLTLRKNDEILIHCKRMEEKRSLLLLWLSDTNLTTIMETLNTSQESRVSINETLQVSQQTYSRAESMEAQVEQISLLFQDINSKSSSTLHGVEHNGIQGQRIIDAISQTNAEIQNLNRQSQDLVNSFKDFKLLIDSNPILRGAIWSATELDDTKDLFTEAYFILDKIHRKQSQSRNQNSENFGARSRTSGCTCRSFSQTEQWQPLSMLHFKRVFVRHHYQECPKSKNSDKNLEYMLRIVPPLWLLRHTINLSIIVHNWRTVFIDRLGKDAVTIPCHKNIDARGVATLFLQWIYRFG